MSSPNIVFWDSYTHTWKARMEFSFTELRELAFQSGSNEMFRLAEELQRHNQERDDFND
jgi:hypothetical protein